MKYFAILGLMVLIAVAVHGGSIIWKNVPDNYSGEATVTFPPKDVDGFPETLKLFLDDVGWCWVPWGPKSCVVQRESPTVELQLQLNGETQDCDPSWWTASEELQVTGKGSPATCFSAQRPEAKDVTLTLLNYDAAQQLVHLKVSSKLIQGDYEVDAAKNFDCIIDPESQDNCGTPTVVSSTASGDQCAKLELTFEGAPPGKDTTKSFFNAWKLAQQGTLPTTDSKAELRLVGSSLFMCGVERGKQFTMYIKYPDISPEPIAVDVTIDPNERLFSTTFLTEGNRV